MSRTKRADLTKARGGKSIWLRKPRGHKRALQAGARAMPPSAWDDQAIGAEAVRQANRKARAGATSHTGSQLARSTLKESGAPAATRTRDTAAAAGRMAVAVVALPCGPPGSTDSCDTLPVVFIE